MSNNVNYFPWEETQEDNIFPTLIGHFRVKEITDGQSQNSGKRMFKAIFECVAPVEYQGQQHFENYVVGSDEAPNAILPGQFGTRNFKKLCKAAQVPPNNDIAVLLRSVEGSELLLSVVEYEETQEGQYKGSKRNRLAGYFRLGEREIGIAPKAGTAAKGTPGGMAAPPVMPPPPQAPPAQQQAAAPNMPPPVTPQTVPPPISQSVAPPQQQVALPPLSAPPQPPPPSAPPQPPAAASGGQMIRCTMCNTDVPVMEYAAHVQAHMTNM